MGFLVAGVCVGLLTHGTQTDAVVMFAQLLQVNVDGAAVEEQRSAPRRLRQTAEQEEEEAEGRQSLHGCVGPGNARMNKDSFLTVVNEREILFQ